MIICAEKEVILDISTIEKILQILDLPKEEYYTSLTRYYPEIETTEKTIKIGKLGTI